MDYLEMTYFLLAGIIYWLLTSLGYYTVCYKFGLIMGGEGRTIQDLFPLLHVLVPYICFMTQIQYATAEPIGLIPEIIPGIIAFGASFYTSFIVWPFLFIAGCYYYTNSWFRRKYRWWKMTTELPSLKDSLFTMALIAVIWTVIRKLYKRSRKDPKQSCEPSKAERCFVSSGDLVVGLVGASIFAAHGIKSMVVIKSAVTYVVGGVLPYLSGFSMFANFVSDDTDPVCGVGFVREVERVCDETLSKATCKCKEDECVCPPAVPLYPAEEYPGISYPKYAGLHSLWNGIEARAQAMKVATLSKARNSQIQLYTSIALVIFAIFTVAAYKYFKKDGKKTEPVKQAGGDKQPETEASPLPKPESVKQPETEASSQPIKKVTFDDTITFSSEQEEQLLYRLMKLQSKKQSDDRSVASHLRDDRYREKDTNWNSDDRSEGERWNEEGQQGWNKRQEWTERNEWTRREAPAGGKKKMKEEGQHNVADKLAKGKHPYKQSESARATPKTGPKSAQTTDVSKSARATPKTGPKQAQITDAGELKKARKRAKAKKPEKQSGIFQLGGLDQRGGIARIGDTWSNFVFAENHFFVPLHAWGKSNQDAGVTLSCPNGQTYTFEKKEGKQVMHDKLAFRFKGPGLAPPSLTLKVPSMADAEVMIVSYQKPEDFATRKFVISHGVISKINMTPGKEMVNYTADTVYGQSGAMCINKARQVVGFHNEVGGFLPVTDELLRQVRNQIN